MYGSGALIITMKISVLLAKILYVVSKVSNDVFGAAGGAVLIGRISGAIFVEGPIHDREITTADFGSVPHHVSTLS